MIKAIIFDVDGTLAETEEAHRAAFNAVYKEHELGWFWDVETYGKLLSVTGGKERIVAFVAGQNLTPLSADHVKAMHLRKNKLYAEAIQTGQVSPRPGVVEFVSEACKRGLLLAIATTTSRDNLDALLRGVFSQWPDDLFASVVCGENVSRKKPDPEVYLTCLKQLGLDASEAIAVEDSEVGLQAAIAAGLRTVVTPSAYTRHHRFDAASVLLSDLNTDLDALFNRFASGV